MTTPTVRTPTTEEVGLLEAIEVEADSRYADVGYDTLASTSGIPADVANRYAGDGRLLVAVVDEQPVGFIAWHTEDDPTVLGIAQVSVLTDFGGRGIGRLLLESVLDHAETSGFRSVVLTTQSDVPWNAPWYRTFGFEVVPTDRWTEWMHAGAENQRRSGIDWEHRVWMTLELP